MNENNENVQENNDNVQNAKITDNNGMKSNVKHKSRVIGQIVLLCVLSLILFASLYVKIIFPDINIDELLYTTQFNLGSADMTPVYDGLLRVGPLYIVFTLLMIFLLRKTKLSNYQKITITMFSIIVLIASSYNLSIQDYAYYKIAKSTFFEEHYVDSKNVELTFPENKKNLVFIFVESFESTLLDTENGGSLSYTLLPEMQRLNEDENTITFKSDNNKIGMKMIDGSNHTSASLISNNSGIPFKFQITSKRLDGTHFFNNAYTLGDILKDNGYTNELISAATTDYGGVKEFFSIHGNYNIIDINNLDEYNFDIEEKDKIDWGFNDGYLYEIAKKRLDELASKDEPFNLTLAGIDTHFPRGYKSDYTIDEFNSQYENVYATESKLISSFVSYIKEQDYYKDTVIVIVGDHESMECAFIDDANIPDEDRFVYASYINVQNDNKEEINTHNRTYTSLDTLPSVLSAMGVKIQGERLGLGTNLFSKEPTITEEHALTLVDFELRKTSKEYTKLFYGEN